MDALSLLIVAVVAIAAVVWYFNRDSESLDINQDGKVDADDVKAAVKKAKAGVKAEVAEVKAKLPTAAKLKAMTKKQIDALGEEAGIKLDARKTKDAMIKDLRQNFNKK